jgi:phosphomevalonate kinase
VSKTNQLKKTDPDKYKKLMDRLLEISIIGSDLFIKSELKKFLNIVYEYYQSLAELGVAAGIPIISDTHQKIETMVRECGGVYKPSGAGGSDIGIAFTDNLQIKEEIIKKTKKSPFKYIKLNIIDFTENNRD